MAVWAGLSGAFTTLTSKVGTNLGGQVLGEDVNGLGVVSGEEEHAHITDWVLLCRVGGTVAAGFLLELYGSRFSTLIWGRGVALDIVASTLVVLRLSGSTDGNRGRYNQIGLVPAVLAENLETVAARMVIGLFVDCARVSWSSKAFKTVSASVRGLVLSSVSGRDPDMTLTLLKSVANLARWLKICSRKEYTCQ